MFVLRKNDDSYELMQFLKRYDDGEVWMKSEAMRFWIGWCGGL